MTIVNEQIDALEDVVFNLDLNTMSRDQLLRLASMGRYIVTQSESLLAERNGVLDL